MRAKHEELAQRATMSWSRLIPELRDTLFHIPNGGHRNIAVARAMKLMGQRAGVYDLFLPMPILFRPLEPGESLGLWLELKSETGRITDKQDDWGHRMRAAGYEAEVAKGFDESRNVLTRYVERHRQAEAQCDTKMHVKR